MRGHFIPFVILVLCVEMENVAFAMEEDLEQTVRAKHFNSVVSLLPLWPRLGWFEIQVRANQDRCHFLALYLVLRTNFGLINGIFC